MSKFIVRTVKHGQVTVGGRQYRPPDHHLRYDGRLEKTRLVFEPYPEREDIIYLWGSLEAYRNDTLFPPDTDVTCVDGTFPWWFWEVVEDTKDKESVDRSIPFEEKAVCASCGRYGAYDIMGDLVCPECI